jgi:hypothetical protein
LKNVLLYIVTFSAISGFSQKPTIKECKVSTYQCAYAEGAEDKTFLSQFSSETFSNGNFIKKEWEFDKDSILQFYTLSFTSPNTKQTYVYAYGFDVVSKSSSSTIWMAQLDTIKNELLELNLSSSEAYGPNHDFNIMTLKSDTLLKFDHYVVPEEDTLFTYCERWLNNALKNLYSKSLPEIIDLTTFSSGEQSRIYTQNFYPESSPFSSNFQMFSDYVEPGQTKITKDIKKKYKLIEKRDKKKYQKWKAKIGCSYQIREYFIE